MIDEILSRPYGRDVPMGCTGDRVWASNPQGWAFGDDVHWLYLTNLKAFDLEIRDEQSLLAPARATYFPGHIHYEGIARKDMTASASFTYATDKVENPLSEPFEPGKRWTCWSSGKRQDWYAVEFATTRTLSGFNVHFFDDAPSGGLPPSGILPSPVLRRAIPFVEPRQIDQVVPRAAQGRGKPGPLRTRRIRAIPIDVSPRR